MAKEKLRKKNFKIFTISNSLMALAVGLFGPFYYIFINDFGGSIENFGIAAGLLVLSGALFSLFSGNFVSRQKNWHFVLPGFLLPCFLSLISIRFISLSLEGIYIFPWRDFVFFCLYC